MLVSPFVISLACQYESPPSTRKHPVVRNASSMISDLLEVRSDKMATVGTQDIVELEEDSSEVGPDPNSSKYMISNPNAMTNRHPATLKTM